MKQIVSLILFLILPVGAATASNNRRLKPSEIEKLKQAVEDEIYDYGYYAKFYEIGENTGTPQHWKARVRIFVNPVYNSTDQHGEVIYKLMPYGQIDRLFYIDVKGEIKLDGDPQNRFPITQPSHQTVFMDDLDVCRDEQSWVGTFFVVDTAPTPDMIKGAAQRQKARTGFSDWEYEHP
ncbi:MAG TPA: hypothetical protein VJO53_09110, partial [Candidatus Acidoferrales bacterium]|nr:hypothetical protein [Candidatus Acidoferrales bacterium]